MTDPEILVSGHSDDLIYVEGDDDSYEIHPPDEDGKLRLDPTGIVLGYEYNTDAEWEFEFLSELPDGVEAHNEKAHEHDRDGIRDYSGVVVVESVEYEKAVRSTDWLNTPEEELGETND